MHWTGIPITRRRIDGREAAGRTPISPGQTAFSARKKSLKIKNNEGVSKCKYHFDNLTV